MAVTNPKLWTWPALGQPIPATYEADQAARMAVFEKIAPAHRGWKGPIKAVIADADFDDCEQAAIWFTGGGLVRRGPVADDGTVCVSAPGYYTNIGS